MKFINSFIYAWQGILVFLKQRNARIQVLMAFLVIALGSYFEVSRVEWLFLLLSIAAVLAAETFNTALEEITDLVSPQRNERAGRAKDLAAAAVLIISISAALIGIIIFLPKVLNLL